MTAAEDGAARRPPRSGRVRPARSGRATGVVAWTLQILLALPIAGGGALKLAGDPAMVRMFDDIGAGQWLRLVTGALEVAGGTGLLVPRVRAPAALGLALLLVVAAVVNVTVLGTGPLSAGIFAVMALGVLVLRRDELRGVRWLSGSP